MKAKVRHWLLCCLFFLWLPTIAVSQNDLSDALKLDLRRIEEAWRILDMYSQKVWPGWTNYLEIPFRIEYPNGVILFIGDPKPVGQFRLVNGVKLRNKNIYIDDSKLNALLLTSYLVTVGGGAGGGLNNKVGNMNIQRGIVTKAQEDRADSVIKSLGNPEWQKEMVYGTEYGILVTIHELFHCYTNFGTPFRTGDIRFEGDLNFAVFSEIEGDLLEKAALDPNLSKAKMYLKKAMVVRKEVERSHTNNQKIVELTREKAEGTAEYATYRLVELMKEYTPSLSHQEDPLYFGFQHRDYILAQKVRTQREVMAKTFSVIAKSYSVGMFLSLALDRFMPEWKEDFFKKNKSFDSLLAKLITLGENEKASLLSEIKDEYKFDSLVQRHSPVIAKRDSVIQSFERSDKYQLVFNFKELGQYPQIISTGATFSRGFNYYYSSGLTTLKVGDFVCENRDLQVWYDLHNRLVKIRGLDSIEGLLPDKIKYDRLDTDGTYYGVTIESGRFSLRASKVRVLQSSGQIEFLLIPGK